MLNRVRPCLWNHERAGKAFGSSGRRRICSQCHCHLLVQTNVFYTWVISLHCARYSKLTTVENAKKYFNLALPTWNRLIFMGFFHPLFTRSVSVGKKKLHTKKNKAKTTHNIPSSKAEQVYWGMATFEQGMGWIVLVIQGNLGVRWPREQNHTTRGHCIENVLSGAGIAGGL